MNKMPYPVFDDADFKACSLLHPNAFTPRATYWITFYNQHYPHTAHDGQLPAVAYFDAIETDLRGQAVA